MDGSQDRRLIHGLRSQALSAAASALARAWLMSERARATSGRGRTGDGRSEGPERWVDAWLALPSQQHRDRWSIDRAPNAKVARAPRTAAVVLRRREGMEDSEMGDACGGSGDGRVGVRDLGSGSWRGCSRGLSGRKYARGQLTIRGWGTARVAGLDRVYKDHRRLHSSFSPSPSTNDERARLRGQTSTN